MSQLTLTLTDMANGGAALGRDETDRVIFVPEAIPGETVLVELIEERKHFAKARLLSVLASSPDRTRPRCPHFGPCGICHFQHIRYEAQLTFKQAIVRDQLNRIGGISGAAVQPVIANPEPYAYSVEAVLNLTADGRLGYWSPARQEVMPVDTCAIISEPLLELLQDLDMQLPGLRKLILRVGDDGSRLAALEVTDAEPPVLETDFPVSVAIVLPDGTAANLVGDNYVIQAIKGRDFRVSAGCYLFPSPPAAGLVVDTVLRLAALSGNESLIELYSGVGTLTAFLAEQAGAVSGVEINPDAVQDAVINLDHCDNVSLYEGPVEEILPVLDNRSELMVLDPPPEGLPPLVIDEIGRLRPGRLIYISSDVATLARDGRRLLAKGYKLLQVQPLDMVPQTYQILTVSIWRQIE